MSCLAVYGNLDEVDILAIGPHPDDIEIGAAGSLLLWGEQGYRIGMADLTCGELGTKGNRETRLSESAEAARRLGSLFRVNLGMPDGAVADSVENRLSLVRLLRATRPRIVLCNYEESRHPDHKAGAQLVQAAFFLSRLPKFCPEAPPHSPQSLFHYLIHEQIAPAFLVDISPTFEMKFEVMSAFASQFHAATMPKGYRYAGLSDYLAMLRSLGEAWGAQAGIQAAEAFASSRPLVVRDIGELL